MADIAEKILEISFILIGLQFLHTAYCTFRDKGNPARLGTSLFWGLLGISFAGGSYLPNKLTGAIVIIIALLTLFKQVRIGTLPESQKPHTPHRRGAPRLMVDGEMVELSQDMADILVRVARAMQQGLAVTVAPQSTRLTTRKAAGLLGVSRSDVMRRRCAAAGPDGLTAAKHCG